MKQMLNFQVKSYMVKLTRFKLFCFVIAKLVRIPVHLSYTCTWDIRFLFSLV